MHTNELESRRRTRPYSIDVVPVDRGWILETIAREIARAAAATPDRYHVRVTAHPRGDADLTFFLPESAWRDDVRDSIRVTYFAHKEDHPGAAALFEEVARKSDVCITSSEKYAEQLRTDGAREVFTIPLGVDSEAFVPKVRIGVVGRTYHTGRKGESLLSRSLDLPFVEFVFTGEGWPSPARYYGERDLVELYQSLNYLLIPSLIEGGPVPMLEALASGCPVIAPTDIGMVSAFPHIPFRRGDAEDLRRVVEGEIEKRLALRRTALPCDWRHFAQRHLELFAHLIDRKGLPDLARRPAISGHKAPAERRLRALLLTHGPEGTAKGGPTTRVRNIIEYLGAHDRGATTADDLNAVVADRYDVIHVFNVWPPDSALAALAAARRSGAKVVFSPIALDLADWPLFHPFMERFLASRPADDALRATLLRLRAATPRRRHGGGGEVPVEGIAGLFENLRLCCDMADRVVVLSECERDYLAAIGARVDHAVLIRNGVDVERMSGAEPDAFRRAFDVDRYVLCVGRLEYRKNQALAALAMCDLGVTFVLVGASGDTGYVNHVRRLGGRNLRVLDRIEDRRLLASGYAGADAFVFPSWTEGAPLAAMEAGAAGTPLILSEMSAEREYFGDDALYVHPADIDGLADAAKQLLARPDTRERREARARRLGARFSVARHAEETWALYEDLCATASSDSTVPVAMDVSALLHFTRMRQPFTGVPLVERNILRELSHLVPALRCIVYNDVKGRFIEIDVGELNEFDEARFNARRWFTTDEDPGVDRRATLRWTDGGMSTSAGIVRAPAENSAAPYRRKAVVFAKRTLQRTPKTLREPITAVLQRVRPGFDPFRMPPRQAAIGDYARPGAAIFGSPLAQSAVTDPPPDAVTRFQDSLGTLVIHDVPRRREIVPVGARLLTLGQSWLSNQPLLDEMIALTRTRALSLEPYVYDLTYHTGAEQSGWADNDDRFNRLLALLRHSRCVFTESRQVENELQKLRATRGFEFSTVRTKLRGRELPDPVSGFTVPRYAPETFVLVVSSFNKRKNHDFLIRVWRDLYETWIGPAARPYRLLLAGQVQEERKFGDPAFVGELRRFNIDVHVDVPDGTMARLMRDCAFTAYPSLQEGWGLPAQESLMCGKVCLVSSTLPVAQEIANPALIRISPNDFYGWHEALRTWLENAQMRRAFAERAREYQAPSWRDIAQTIALRKPSD